MCVVKGRAPLVASKTKIQTKNQTFEVKVNFAVKSCKAIVELSTWNDTSAFEVMLPTLPPQAPSPK